MTHDTVHYELVDGLAWIRLDDGKVNAMNPTFFAGLGAALDQAEADLPSAVIITGRTGRFSAGLDIRLVPTLTPPELDAFSRDFGRLMLRVYNLPLPTIAALNGHAIAGGVVLAAACDLRYGLQGDFRFHLSEVQIGIPLPSWAAQMVETIIPIPHRPHFILHAKLHTHEQAAQAGILHGVSPDEDALRERVRSHAASLHLNRAAYRITKARLRAPHQDRLAQLADNEGLDFSGT